MADVWANSMACHPRATCHIAGCCHLANLVSMIPELRVTLQGAATWWIYCHDSRATCHIAGCNNSIRHIENHFSPYFIFYFLMQFRLWRTAQLSYRLRYTCVICCAAVVCLLSYCRCFSMTWTNTACSWNKSNRSRCVILSLYCISSQGFFSVQLYTKSTVLN